MNAWHWVGLGALALVLLLGPVPDESWNAPWTVRVGVLIAVIIGIVAIDQMGRKPLG